MSVYSRQSREVSFKRARSRDALKASKQARREAPAPTTREEPTPKSRPGFLRARSHDAQADRVGARAAVSEDVQAQTQTASQSQIKSAAGQPILACLFIVSIMVPIVFKLGPLVLLPYRLFLLIMFVPLFVRLVGGRAGGMLPVDWLILGSTTWSALSLLVNHPPASVIEPVGIYYLEFFGAYALARVSIRSAQDFMKVVRLLVLSLFILLPFGVIEAVTNYNIPLSVMPGATPDSNQGVRFGLYRAQAVFSHSIHYGVFSAAILGLAWYAYAPFKRWTRFILTTPIAGVSTALSLSTGPLIAFNIQLILILWEMLTKPLAKRWTIFAWICIIGYIIVDFLATASPFHTIVSRLALSQQSAYTRILIFEHGMNNVYANPLFGLGQDVVHWVRPSYLAESVDNFWLLLTMRYGAPAFFLLMIGVIMIVRKISRVPLTDPADRACRAAILTTLGGMIIAGGTVDYWKAILSFFMFLLGAGVWTYSGGASTEAGANADEENASGAGGARNAGTALSRTR